MDISFSHDLHTPYATEVEVRPITKKGRDYFAMRFSPGALSVRLQKCSALALQAMLEAAGLAHSVDDPPLDELPALLRHQAD